MATVYEAPIRLVALGGLPVTLTEGGNEFCLAPAFCAIPDESFGHYRSYVQGLMRPDAEGHDRVVEFGNWVADTVVNRRISDPTDWLNTAPHARRSHPADEHFRPLFATLGAGGPDASIERIGYILFCNSFAIDMYLFA